MSRRVFYIVHLDKGRILALSVIGAGLILSAFAAGFRFAGSHPRPADAAMSAEIGRDATRSLLAPRQDNTAAREATDGKESTSSASREESTSSIRDEAKPDSQRAGESTATRSEEGTRTSKRSDDRGSETSSEDHSRSTEERLALAKKKVNLLDSALPEEERGSNLDVYRRRVSDKTEKEPSTSSEDRKDRKPTKHRVKHERKEKTGEKAEKHTKKKKDPTDRQHRKKKEKKKVEAGNDQDQASSTPGESTAPVSRDAASQEGDGFSLQMGAYQTKDAALRLAGEVRKLGVPVSVVKNGQLHTVRTAATTDRDDLSRTEKKLRSLNFSPIPVRVKP